MKVLVTGATGFIGSYVLRLLRETDHKVYVISRSLKNESNWYQADILNTFEINKIINTINPDVLIHLAWNVAHGEFWNAANNEDYAEASKNLFDIFLKNGGKKIIATGTCAEYPTSDKPVKEDVEYDGELTPYGKAKKSVFDYLTYEKKKNNFEFTWLRIFGIYGEGEDNRRLFPTIINSIIKNEEFISESQNSYFDYVYVEDVASFIVYCIYKKGLDAVNIGTGKSLSIKDIHDILTHYIKVGLFKVVTNKIPPNLNSRIPDCSKLKKNNLNFVLESGFNKIINNYRN